LFPFFNVFLAAAAKSLMLTKQGFVCPFSNHALR
jgi:hypothetical protein